MKNGKRPTLHSKPDSRGVMFVDCSECSRGGNGNQDCSSGWQVRKPKRGGCFMGEVLFELKERIEPSIS